VRALLPRIDATTCLGCYACVDACPFDVLEIQKYVAVVARPSDCCGVVLCQQVCPNGSLTIAEGEPIEHRLRLSEHNESLDAPGVYVAGDLSGIPLIKNAIGQGVRVVDRVAATLPRSERSRGGDGDGDGDGRAACDVVIVGAGPAGLSAALRAQELGLSYVCLEQGSVASSIRSFPRNKLVFDQPMNLPVEGDLWLREATKEELLSQWTRIVRKRQLAVLENHRVSDVARLDGKFVVTADAGASAPRSFVAPRLVLCIGKRGTPRVLECPIDPAAAGKVAYSLADARSFASQRVLIVGLGDSAMEAAIAIARQPGTTVTISYRGSDVSRGRARNVAELKALIARGRVRIVYESRVSRVNVSTVTLDAAGGPLELANDAVLALIGGTPTWDLLQRAGIKAGAVAANGKL
jgi:thioredoxin reductase/NAD-dependent dihydropyrimidine dehydrogenase PreA subunit